MRYYLTLLATTKNNNSADQVASDRISEIYNCLKQNSSLSKKEAEYLIREALQLKGIPREEIEDFLAPPVHLFCFPYAGGSASIYDKWPSYFPSQIKVQPIEYPGRGSKAREKLVPSLDSLLEILEKEVFNKLPKGAPFAFFGHSLGAIIAFELALLFKNKHHLDPVTLFLSGSPSPDRIPSFPVMASMSDDVFVEAIQELKGTPEGLIQTEEFRNFFLPILRNDFSLLDGHINRPLETLAVPLVLFGGNNDSKVSFIDIKKWASWTKTEAFFYEVAGDHFFIHQPQGIIEKIKESLCLIPC